MLSLNELKEIYQQEQEEIQRDYFEFLKFKSIATDPSFDEETKKCGDWLFAYLEKMGLKVERWETSGKPCFFATYDGGGDETLLLYCHYDVQPVDPLELWTSPPFVPSVREGKIYARGAVDNKGQCFYTMRALKTLIERVKPKLKIHFLIEGEEESGSNGLHGVLEERKERLKADHILIVDAGIEKKDEPAICLGVRGLICFDITLTISKSDFHSGVHGGMVYNPNRALAEVISSFYDEKNRVAVEGFYDSVQEFTEQEKKEFKMDFDSKNFEETYCAQANAMERGLSPLESTWVRPTLEINGMSGGYTGAGFKTVIPAQAQAKISCRLVPNQDPKKIADLVKKHIEKHTPKGVDVRVHLHPSLGRPVRSSSKSKIAQVMRKTYSEVFGKECSLNLMGGSIPIAADLADVAGGDIIFIGMGLPGDKIHAPDEHFSFDRLERGYLVISTGIQLLAQNGK